MGEQKKEKFELKGELDRIDKQAKIKNLSPLEWEQRYYIETVGEDLSKGRDLLEAKSKEMLVGSRRLNSKFFHKCANGRRRKGSIISLDTKQG